MDSLFLCKGISVKTPDLLEIVNDHTLSSIRVFLVDDNPDFLAATSDFLNSDPQIEIIGLAQSGMDAVQRVDELHPDLVLMDLVMPGINGLAATRLIKAKSLATRVIILTQHDDPLYRFQAEAVNADGFIAKSEIDEGLLALIHAIGKER
jgi:DNA-binding NarL/FixJ family response regulator